MQMEKAPQDIDDLIENICKKMQCSVVLEDLNKLKKARDILATLQRKEMFTRVSETYDKHFSEEFNNLACREILEEDLHLETLTDQLGDEEECLILDHEIFTEDLAENSWHGYFKGYSILSEAEEFNINENKKCIELTKSDCDETMDSYLRCGIRCFVIDLFSGTSHENQTVIVRLRENEINVSKEIGFPVVSTLFAKLSPRLQYTGLMDPPDAVFDLEKDDEITLTAERYWSTRGSKKRIYVNACFLIVDIKVCDFILIGPDIQVQVKRVTDNHMRCTVVMGGKLQSRLPVLFPGKCNKFRISLEELEDITFAKEVGINAIVSYIPGTEEYYRDLIDILKLLNCEKMRLFARIVLNEIKGCDDDMHWVAKSYDGFVVELNPSDENEEPINIMHLCPSADMFIKRIYTMQKPIIFDPSTISNNRIIVDPEYYLHVFYFPDKYVFKCEHTRNSFYFYILQNAIFNQLPQLELSKLPYCDQSLTGSDSMARACVSAAYEMHAAVIFVCGLTGRMATKIAHFRPKVPIIFISCMKSAEDFISMYHNVIMLYFRGKGDNKSHRKAVFKELLFGLLYARARNFVKHGNNVLLVYNEEIGTKFLDKYVAYKFDSNHFPKQLSKTIF